MRETNRRLSRLEREAEPQSGDGESEGLLHVLRNCTAQFLDVEGSEADHSELESIAQECREFAASLGADEGYSNGLVSRIPNRVLNALADALEPIARERGLL